MTLKYLTVLTFILGGSSQLFAQGYIVPYGVTTNYISGSGEISVIHDPANQFYTGFFLNPLGISRPSFYTNTFSFSVVLDVGVRVFLVSSNDPISLQPILSQNWPELGGSPSYRFANNVPFYVGLYTGYDFAPTYPPSPPYYYLDPVYGWAELVNNQGVIQVLTYAVEYGGAGIYAGTQNIITVPEPGTVALLVAGGLLGAWRWRMAIGKI